MRINYMSRTAAILSVFKILGTVLQVSLFITILLVRFISMITSILTVVCQFIAYIYLIVGKP